MTEVPTSSGFEPTDKDLASVTEWFERYDALAAANDYQAMADVAMFPLNEVTDGKAMQLDRDEYIAQMAEVMGGTAGEVTMDVTRTPHFLSEGLVFVVSDGTMTYNGHTQPIRYGDLLVKGDGSWFFQTMVQGGWG